MELLLRRKSNRSGQESVARLALILLATTLSCVCIAAEGELKDAEAGYASALNVIKNPHSSEVELLSAFRQLNGTKAVEGYDFWLKIANSREYPAIHRKLCMLAIFARCIPVGYRVDEFKNLGISEWFGVKTLFDASDYSVVPVDRTSVDRSIFMFRHPLLGNTAVYVRLSKIINLDKMLDLVNGHAADKDVTVSEVKFSNFDLSSNGIAGENTSIAPKCP
jgi:hypothetical protein